MNNMININSITRDHVTEFVASDGVFRLHLSLNFSSPLLFLLLPPPQSLPCRLHSSWLLFCFFQVTFSSTRCPLEILRYTSPVSSFFYPFLLLLFFIFFIFSSSCLSSTTYVAALKVALHLDVFFLANF